MEYEVQSARITTTGKLPDRFLNCQAKAATDLTKTYMGTVYSLVEIVSPWFSTAQVGQIIINTFHQNYYLGGSTSDLANFEEALKCVNQALAEATQNGETNWIGNLNAILAVVIENKIHLSQTGKAEAYIFREGKINHLTYGLGQNQVETRPLKTFSNVTSGELKSKDKVLITNPDLLSEIDLETLREIIALHRPDEAILQIAKILKRKKIKTVNCLVLDLLSLEEASRQPVNTLSDNIHLDKPIESFWALFGKAWKSLKPVFHFTGATTKKATTHSWAFTKKYLDQMKNRKSEELPRKKDLFDKEFLSQTANDDGLLKDEEIQYSPELNVHHYEKQLAEKHNPWRPIVNILGKIWSLMVAFLFWVWEGVRQRKTRPYFVVALAIIILVILGFVINARRHGNSAKLTLLEAQNILREAEAAQRDAKMAGLSNDQNKALELFGTCLDKSQKIVNTEVVKSSAQDVFEDCQGELDKLTATTRFDGINPIVTADKSTKMVFVIAGKLYFVSQDTIYESAVSGGAPSKVATLPRNNGDFQFGAVSGSNFYLYTSAQKVYEFTTESNKLELAKINGEWETANAMAYYAGNIYLLDGILGQIYRHSSGQNSYEDGQAYISSGSIDVKNSSSLAVDGSIYVLRSSGSSGEALELQKGKLQDFSLRDIPLPQSNISKPVKIYTDADTTSIYILDGGAGRIVEFDKDGRFVHQYALPSDFNNLTDFAVSVKAKKIWVLNENQLFEISI